MGERNRLVSLEALLVTHGQSCWWPRLPAQVAPNDATPESLALLMKKLEEQWA